MSFLPLILILFGYAAVIAAAPKIGIAAVVIHIAIMCIAAALRRRDPRAPRQ